MSPRHILVLMKGHIFSFEAINVDDRILTVAELESQFRNIRKQCEQLPLGPGLSALTVDDRKTWCMVSGLLLCSYHPVILCFL